MCRRLSSSATGGNQPKTVIRWRQLGGSDWPQSAGRVLYQGPRKLPFNTKAAVQHLAGRSRAGAVFEVWAQ